MKTSQQFTLEDGQYYTEGEHLTVKAKGLTIFYDRAETDNLLLTAVYFQIQDYPPEFGRNKAQLICQRHRKTLQVQYNSKFSL